VQRRRERHALPLALERVEFRLADRVTNEVQLDLAVVTLDRKHLFEDALQPHWFALVRIQILLQEVNVGLRLNLNEIRRLNRLYQFTEVLTL